MPDSTDFAQAAQTLNAAADEVRRINTPVAAAAGPEVLSGGRLGDSLADFIANSEAEVQAIANELEGLANQATGLAVQAILIENAVGTAPGAPLAPGGSL